MSQANEDLLESLAETFIQFRHEAGLTQRQAAAAANTTQARISYLETARGDLYLRTVQHHAAVYGYDIEIHFVKSDPIAAAMAELADED